MEIRFQVTPTILTQVYNFAQLQGRLYALDPNNKWVKRLGKLALLRGGYAAVSIDKTLPRDMDFKRAQHLSASMGSAELAEFEDYTHALENLNNIFSTGELSLPALNRLHGSVLGLKPEASRSLHYRTSVRILPKLILENGVHKTVNLEVKTKPERIVEKLEEFVEWFSAVQNSFNSILLAGITHYKLAEIHPFTDGNGRVSRLLERFVLQSRGVDPRLLISTEDFYLRNRERYYALLESTIEQKDLTKWLEFYSEGLLVSISANAELLRDISGGTIDIIANKIEALTEREEQLVDIIVELEQASGAEIAKKLKVSRQNINLILKKLYRRGILQRIGKSTSSRYKIAG